MNDPFLPLPYDKRTHWGKLELARTLSEAKRILTELGLDTAEVEQGYVRVMAAYTDGLHHRTGVQ